MSKFSLLFQVLKNQIFNVFLEINLHKNTARNVGKIMSYLNMHFKILIPFFFTQNFQDKTMILIFVDKKAQTSFEHFLYPMPKVFFLFMKNILHLKKILKESSRRFKTVFEIFITQRLLYINTLR